MTPWVSRLLAANIGLFLLTMVFPMLRFWLGYIPALTLTRPWTVVTYMFVHGGLWHLLFNMLALYFFGPQLEARIGSRNFVGLYFASGLTGALLSLYTPSALIIGASGAVYGVMFGFARYWPRVQILIWGIIPVEARVLVFIMTLLALFGARGLGQRGVAHLAHLGGFVGGYLYLKIIERWSPAARFRARARPTARPPGATDIERWSRIDPSALHPVNREELDRVLSKVARSGPDSLSPDERSFLDRFSGA
jgi:membrane associated rhomboid family serine protease